MNDELVVRLPLMVTRAKAEEIDAWRYSNKIPTRAEAIRQLIDRGLASAGPPAKTRAAKAKDVEK